MTVLEISEMKTLLTQQPLQELVSVLNHFANFCEHIWQREETDTCPH